NSRRDSHQPPDKGNASPLEFLNAGQGLAKNVGGQILRLMPVANAPDDVSIDAIEVLLVQIGKASGVPLGSLDQKSLVMALAHVSLLSSAGRVKKLRDDGIFRDQYLILAWTPSNFSPGMPGTCFRSASALKVPFSVRYFTSAPAWSAVRSSKPSRSLALAVLTLMSGP